MALSVTSQSAPYVDKLYVETDANAVANDAVTAGAATIYIVDIDNSNNSSAVYAKLFNHAAPTEGTTEPNFIFKAPKQTRQTITITEGSNFATNVSFMCVTGRETASQIAPTNKVTLRLMAE